MPFRPDDYDGSYCINCRQPYPEIMEGFDCPVCGYFDDGLMDDLEDNDGLDPGDAEWMAECDAQRDENFRQLVELVERERTG